MDIFKSIKKQSKETNPIDDKSKESKRIMPDIESDSFKGIDELEIVRMVMSDAKADKQCMSQWVEDRLLDLKMYEGYKPSTIEGLDKESWMSDRNLGITGAICDTFQATLLSTCYNIDSIHAVDTERNDVDMKDNIAKFSKWMVSKQACDVFPEVNDFIHNKITMGTACFFVSWKIWYEWVDLRNPKYSTVGDKPFIGYNIKTEYKRFEQGSIENIDDMDDLLVPEFGDTLQKKAHVIRVVHKKASDLLDDGIRKIYRNVDEDLVKKLKMQCYDTKIKLLGKEKAEALGLTTYEDIGMAELSDFPVDIYEWYGPLTVNKMTEEYRVTVEPSTKTLIGLKPLRKITRTGRRPFVGSGFIRRPGKFQGKSLPRLIMDPSNALNNVYNQKSDFQYVENVPAGTFKPDERYQQQTYKFKPGDFVPSDNPQDLNPLNMQRSMAWAEFDIDLMFQIIEKQTGAAAYFMSNAQNASGTATRDVLINQKSETRFGKWVKEILDDISEAITMLFQYYQDNAPPGLGERILGDDGKPIFNSFSIETIRGGYDVRFSPDIISGSKTLEREIAMWGFTQLSQSIWFNPQINPRGSWKLTNYAAKKMGLPDVDGLMPPEPKATASASKTVMDKFTRLKQGERLEVENGDDVIELYVGFNDLKEKKYYDLDKEYRPNFDNYLFKLSVAFIKAAQQMYEQQVANNLAMNFIRQTDKGINPQQQAPQMPMGQPVAQPTSGLNTDLGGANGGY